MNSLRIWIKVSLGFGEDEVGMSLGKVFSPVDGISFFIWWFCEFGLLERVKGCISIAWILNKI